MSDTPRTDSMVERAPIGLRTNAAFEQSCDLCRTLERELNAANDLFRKLNIHSLDLADRIRRLEEAGDFMSLCLTKEEPFRSSAKEKWTKAKEAKP